MQDQKKTSADYQRAFRERMRAAGYVKRDVWVPPEQSEALRACELALRKGIVPIIVKRRRAGMGNTTNTFVWTTETLLAALTDTDAVRTGRLKVESIEGLEPCIGIRFAELEDLPVFMIAGGTQLLVSTLLWRVDEVADPAGFNTLLLRTHKILPLSTFGIVTMPDGDYYELFGALSAASDLEEILEEIETLGDNAVQVYESFGSYLKRAD